MGELAILYNCVRLVASYYREYILFLSWTEFAIFTLNSLQKFENIDAYSYFQTFLFYDLKTFLIVWEKVLESSVLEF